MNSNPTPDPMEILMNTYLEELLEMSDEQVLEETDPNAVQAIGIQMLNAAKIEAGRLRLEAARLKLQAKREAGSPAKTSQNVGITADEARAALRRSAAANDGRYTLAARQLEEMADEDVIRTYLQLLQLEGENQSYGEDKGG